MSRLITVNVNGTWVAARYRIGAEHAPILATGATRFEAWRKGWCNLIGSWFFSDHRPRCASLAVGPRSKYRSRFVTVRFDGVEWQTGDSLDYNTCPQGWNDV